MKQFGVVSMLKHALLLAPAALTGCVGLPSGIRPVQDFDIDRYLGKWYEIARLDHRFERGLTDVTATYTRREDGKIDVLNQGFNPKEDRWERARGKASFVKSPTVGYLKVSFFGPFYGSYVIIALDREGYDYALVCGPNRSYLWILARQPTLNQTVLDRLIARARDLGFATDKLILVEHSRPD